MARIYRMALTAKHFRSLSSEEIEKIFFLLPELRKRLGDHAGENALEHADTAAASYLRYIAEIDKAIKEGNESPVLKKRILQALFMKLINPESGFGTNDELRDIVRHITNELFNSEIPASAG